VSCGHSGLQQIKRARYVDIDESPRMETYDVRLMKGAGMDDCFDATISKDALHDCCIGHRTDDVRVGSAGATSRPITT
jgi:hypothetical protein